MKQDFSSAIKYYTNAIQMENETLDKCLSEQTNGDANKG